MPRKRFIDKNNATTFTLVHRPQADPLIHDPSASDRVFAETDTSQTKSRNRKVKERGDLEEEFGLSIRHNEGEAANHGVFYDDTEYDYMQHLRELGSSTEAQYVDAPQIAGKQKRKGLDEALKEMKLEDTGDDLGWEGTASMSGWSAEIPQRQDPHVKRRTLEAQQDVPDAIAGFQPDMDPRLREVLEALDDEAYAEDEDDIFAELARDAEEVEQAEWGMARWEEESHVPYGEGEEDEGWETDDTAKPVKEYKDKVIPPQPIKTSPPSTEPLDTTATPAPGAEATDPTNGAWLTEFSKYKKALQNPPTAPPATAPSNGIGPPSSILTTPTSVTAGGRRKKRKGALTDISSYSMTSSALHRTAQQTLLDARFDKIEEFYANHDDDAFADANEDDVSLSGLSAASGVTESSRISKASRLSSASAAPSLVSASAAGALRTDFDGIMDEFLGARGAMGGRRRGKGSGTARGMAQLDEVRRELGPARIGGKLECT